MYFGERSISNLENEIKGSRDILITYGMGSVKKQDFLTKYFSLSSTQIIISVASSHFQ